LAQLASLIAGLAACGPGARDGGSPPTGHAKALETAAITGPRDQGAGGVELFDKVVRADLLFPDAKQRALYQELPVQTIRGNRVYGFALRLQPGMQKDRHFHIVSVAAYRVGERTDAGRPGLTFGPNGAFWDKVVRTPDARYELRVSEGSLLPNGVQAAEFDLDLAAQAIVKRYGELTASR
jgi:hypothetical protein